MTELRRAAVASLRDEFHRVFGRRAEGVWAAPGRVNLIGEHTDYNDGLVLPIAIDRETIVAVARRDDDVVQAWSRQTGTATAMSIDDAPACRGGWTAYVVGTAWALRQDGAPVRGLDVAVTSNIPMGAGLSSSAALTCATALAVTELNSITVDRMVLARAAQRAERDVVGAPVGLMDQVASLLGRKGAAVLVDCRTTALAYLPLPDGLALVVIDTKVRHSNASGGYESRRRECAQAARLLGVPALRDASLHDVDGLPEPLRRRARHVVTENSRVVDAVDALGRHRHDDLATLLSASHASLRDDFEVSVPELDLAVATATDTGAIGARMTGGGFGGAALALTPHDRVDAVTDAVMAAFSAAGFRRPSVLVVASADAADRVAD